MGPRVQFRVLSGNRTAAPHLYAVIVGVLTELFKVERLRNLCSSAGSETSLCNN
jgi:hypothetical protein